MGERSGAYRILVEMSEEKVGRGNVIGIATCYGLDGLGIESRWGPDFPQTSRPDLGLTQPPVQWVSCLFPEDKVAAAWC